MTAGSLAGRPSPLPRQTGGDLPVLELTGEATPVRELLGGALRHRELLRVLAAQDYRSRYRSASLGLLWSILLPLLQGVVIAVVFSRLIGGGSAGSYVPYVITGITVWSYLQQSTLAASTAVVDQGAIAGKIYFPRLYLPGIAPSANLPSLAISLVIAEAVALVAGRGIHLSLLLLPVVVVEAWLLVLFAGALAALGHVYSRDVRYVMQAGLLVLFYATPIIYFLSAAKGGRALPGFFVPLALANPATGVVQLCRQAVIGTAADLAVAQLSLLAWLVVLGAATVAAYARYERVACDRL